MYYILVPVLLTDAHYRLMFGSVQITPKPILVFCYELNTGLCWVVGSVLTVSAVRHTGAILPITCSCV